MQVNNEEAIAFYKKFGFEIKGNKIKVLFQFESESLFSNFNSTLVCWSKRYSAEIIKNYYSKIEPPDCYVLTKTVERGNSETLKTSWVSDWEDDVDVDKWINSFNPIISSIFDMVFKIHHFSFCVFGCVCLREAFLRVERFLFVCWTQTSFKTVMMNLSSSSVWSGNMKSFRSVVCLFVWSFEKFFFVNLWFLIQYKKWRYVSYSCCHRQPLGVYGAWSNSWKWFIHHFWRDITTCKKVEGKFNK